MSITDELREWARDNTVQGEVLTTHPAQHPVHGTLESLLAIADRIDEELAERYVALPLDADGVPIRVGDEMEPISVKYDRFGVVTLCLDTRDGRWSLLTDLDGDWSNDELCQLRHYHAPAVEDVLREFADEVRRCCDTADTIAEYAAKLRLAGEDE